MVFATNADLVNYPGIDESFENTSLKTVYYKSQVVINQYPAYNCGIRLLGFRFIELDGYVYDRVEEQTDQIFRSLESALEMSECDFRIAHEHFSLEFMNSKLAHLLGSI